jgi:phosphinothricin acetyltransferase
VTAIRDASEADLPAIVAIYNAAIPGRMATADTEPVSVESRRAWFAEHAPDSRPLWVASALLSRAVEAGPRLRLRTLLGFIFAHNAPSLGLFEGLGFQRWALLPRVAELDGAERDLVIVGRRIAEQPRP